MVMPDNKPVPKRFFELCNRQFRFDKVNALRYMPYAHVSKVAYSHIAIERQASDSYHYYETRLFTSSDSVSEYVLSTHYQSLPKRYTKPTLGAHYRMSNALNQSVSRADVKSVQYGNGSGIHGIYIDMDILDVPHTYAFLSDNLQRLEANFLHAIYEI